MKEEGSFYGKIGIGKRTGHETTKLLARGIDGETLWSHPSNQVTCSRRIK